MWSGGYVCDSFTEKNTADTVQDNLRYTLSSCMFGVPEERVSISSPCQVTCAPLNASIGYHLTNDSKRGDPSTRFCTASRFDDATINNCAFCYSLIPQQLFTANCMYAMYDIGPIDSLQSCKLSTSSAVILQPAATPSSQTGLRSSMKH